MKRVLLIDILRGLAFIFMIIQHIFYFYDVSNDYNTRLSKNNIIKMFGIISRTLFILLAGYSVYMAYNKNKNDYIINRISRSIKILYHAIIISLITYILYPKYFIRFGILHFMCFGTLLISFIAPYNKLSILILLISLLIKYPKINPIIDTITGSHSHYYMMDWFPLNKWLPILICGLIIGQNIDINELNLFKNDNILSELGKNSLNLYTLHLIILLSFYKFKNNI